MVAKSERATKHPGRPSRLLPNAADLLPDKLPSIRLRHGQVLWLLTELGFRGPASKETFYEYVKSLRKMGIPFGREKFQTKPTRRFADYSFCRVMELAVALSLRFYHVVPDSVLSGIMQHRSHLDRLYQRAYARRDSGAGRPIVLKVKGHRAIVFRGLFLDLNIKFAGGRMVHFGPPKLLASIDALERFSQSTAFAMPIVPMSLSLLSEQIIALALWAPYIHNGLHAPPMEKTGPLIIGAKILRPTIDKRRVSLSGRP